MTSLPIHGDSAHGDPAQDVLAGAQTKAVALLAGQTLRVELVDMASAGYLWSLVQLPVFLEQLPGEESPASEVGLMGTSAPVGGFRPLSIRFLATQAGEGRVEFEHKRPWEPGPGALVSIGVECRAPATEPSARSPRASPKA